MRKLQLLAIFLFGFSIFVIPKFSSAITSSGGSDIILSSSPETPGPNTKVDITLESYATDVTRASITWLVNGKTFASGIGKSKITITTGAVGSGTEVMCIVNKQGGGSLTDTIYFRPAEVDLVWQVDSYTPPLYRGKPLHTSQSAVTVVAIPNIVSGGSRIAAEKLVYKWTNNGQNLVAQSGFGKNTLKLPGSKLFGQDTVNVKVSTVDNSVQANGAVNIPTVDPDIRFYDERPLLGPSRNLSISKTITTTSKNLLIRLEPYFFTKSDVGANNLEVNCVSSGSSLQVNKFLLALSEENSGKEIQCGVNNPAKQLQRNAASFTPTLNYSQSQ